MYASAGSTSPLEELRARTSAVATAVVSSNGAVLAARLPEGVYADTLSIMCATAVGALETASRELGLPGVERIVLEGPDSFGLLVRISPSAILVVILPPGGDRARAEDEVKGFVARWGPS